MINNCEFCLKIDSKQTTKMSKKVTNITFTNYHRQFCDLFGIYIDPETNLKEIEKINKDNPNESYTDQY